MAAEVKKEIELEIAHVLFIDIVDYSKLSVNEQHARIAELNEAVRLSEQFQRAEAINRILKIPTGDGMALVFYKSPEEPAQCAFEISRALKDNQRLQVRMGIHSGPVSGVVDVNERTNVAGAGINRARAVIHVLAGDAATAQVEIEKAREMVEAKLREQPDAADSMIQLSWINLALKRDAEALRLARQATELVPLEKDALAGAFCLAAFAEIQARAGQPAEAVKTLQRLLSIPAGHQTSIQRLKIDPVWDPIRNDPSFQELLAGKELIGPNK